MTTLFDRIRFNRARLPISLCAAGTIHPHGLRFKAPRRSAHAPPGTVWQVTVPGKTEARASHLLPPQLSPSIRSNCPTIAPLSCRPRAAESRLSSTAPPSIAPAPTVICLGRCDEFVGANVMVSGRSVLSWRVFVPALCSDAYSVPSPQSFSVDFPTVTDSHNGH